MARPSTITDLDSYEQQGESLGSLSVGEFADNPAMLKAAASMIESMTKAGHVVTNAYSGRVDFHRVIDPETAERRIKSAQREWDKREIEYELMIELESKPDSTYALRRWCEGEGKVIPEDREWIFTS